MSDPAFPKPIGEILATAVDLCRHQNEALLLDVLENAHADMDMINYDNWDGGTYTWALRLEVPVGVFVRTEPQLADTETRIAERLAYLGRIYPNHVLGEVTISPATAGTRTASRLVPSDYDVRGIWAENCFRVFLSHVSKHKVAASSLKDD